MNLYRWFRGDNNSQKVMTILKKLQKEGKTIVVVTHNENIAKQCDKIIHL